MGENLFGLISFFIFLENLEGGFCLLSFIERLSLGDKSKTNNLKTHSRLFI